MGQIAQCQPDAGKLKISGCSLFLVEEGVGGGDLLGDLSFFNLFLVHLQ